MKKYIDPQAEVICLTSADMITTSPVKDGVFSIGDLANFGDNTYSIDAGFWG